jgi:hypothetical protein
MKLTVSIKTENFPPVNMTAEVETFEHVGKLGRKLDTFVRNSVKLFPDLKGAAVGQVAVIAGDSAAGKRKRARKGAAASASQSVN